MARKTKRDEHFAEAGWTVRDGECLYESGLLVSCCTLPLASCMAPEAARRSVEVFDLIKGDKYLVELYLR